MSDKPVWMHETLKAYGVAIEFYQAVREIRVRLPRGSGPLGDQLSRAAQSICLNLAEGAASHYPEVKRRFWKIALASTGECAAALDLIEIDKAAAIEVATRARDRLRVATPLTRGLVR